MGGGRLSLGTFGFCSVRTIVRSIARGLLDKPLREFARIGRALASSIRRPLGVGLFRFVAHARILQRDPTDSNFKVKHYRQPCVD